MKINTIILLLLLFVFKSNSQSIPSVEENIPFLVTFGKDAPSSYGDDDNCQIIFIVVPKSQTTPIFLRVFDPDTGGKNDEARGDFNTAVSFSIYGGKGCVTDKDAQQPEPIGNYKSGNLLASKTFGVNDKYDNNYYTFGPLNPSEGENTDVFGGYVFKVIIQGKSGNDGNLYRIFLSTSPSENIKVEGGNAFTFEYSFRLHDDPNQISHIYPFVDDKTISVKQTNFDWDDDGYVRIVSIAKKGELLKTSGDDEWKSSEHKIQPSEKNSSLDIQFIKSSGSKKLKNNVVMYVTNQYGEYLPFYAVPIGGVPKYQFSIGITPK